MQHDNTNSELKSITNFARSVNDAQSNGTEAVPAFAKSVWSEYAAFGVQGWATPSSYSGSGYDVSQCCERLAALGYGCNDNGLLFSLGTQMWGIQQTILRFGSNTQKSRYLPELATGAVIGAHAINESGSGSDALNLSCTAKKVGDQYVLNGEKTFIALAPLADFSIIYASTNTEHGRWGISVFLVDRACDGYTAHQAEPMMGLRSSPVGSIDLDNCTVPEAALLGKEGAGASIFNYVQLWERSLLLAPQIGTMKRQLESCISFAQSQIRNDIPIGKHQSVSGKIADMSIRLRTCQLLQQEAASRLESDQQDANHASMVKLHLCEAFEKNSRDAIAIHGGLGYSAHFEHEGNLRDAIGSSIYGGTNDLQRSIIASHLGL